MECNEHNKRRRYASDVLDLFLQVVPQLLPNLRILRILARLADACPWNEVLQDKHGMVIIEDEHDMKYTYLAVQRLAIGNRACV